MSCNMCCDTFPENSENFRFFFSQKFGEFSRKRGNHVFLAFPPKVPSLTLNFPHTSKNAPLLKPRVKNR